MSDVVEILLLAAEQGDMGRKPDPSDYRRRAAAEITRLRAQVASLNAEVEGERERCARVLDAKSKEALTHIDTYYDRVTSDWLAECAAAIREGG